MRFAIGAKCFAAVTVLLLFTLYSFFSQALDNSHAESADNLADKTPSEVSKKEIERPSSDNLTDLVLRFVPARRPSPTVIQPGALIFPLYTHFPGTGSTAGAGFLGRNVFNSRANLLAAATFGDLSVFALGVGEIHAIKERLIFGSYVYDARVPNQIFEREAAGGKSDFFNDDRKSYGGVASAELHTLEQRLQLLAQLGASRMRFSRVADAAGSKFENRDSREFDTLNHLLRLRFDLTDQLIDPRKGLRVDFSHYGNDYFDSDHSRYSILTMFSTVYVPIRKASTWAFNFSRSAASVYDRNTKTLDKLKRDMSLNCPSLSDAQSRTSCESVEQKRSADRFAENQNGTVLPLGGSTQMRGFPSGRVRGSQTVFYGTELRLNLTDENTPFNLLFFSGVRSIVQLALFYELGGAADPPDELSHAQLLADYGLGLRLGFSGALVRADIALGREGQQFTLFFGYPWEPALF